jgi:hypothetical protein
MPLAHTNDTIFLLIITLVYHATLFGAKQLLNNIKHKLYNYRLI